MSNLKYFQACTTKQSAKKLFRELAKKYHPDTNKETDTTNIMASIIAEYESIIKILPSDKTEQSNFNNMTEEEQQTFISQEMQEILNNISYLPITIEIIGSWIWVSGDTMSYKSYLTAYNFRWCPKKKMYSWHMTPYKKYGKTKDINDIRETYGTTKVNNKFRPTLT